MRIIKLLILLLLITAVPTFAGKIKNSEQLVKAMHKKYAKKWYKTFTFVQKNTQFSPNGTKQNSVWYEAMSLPGKLRIDFAPIEKNNGMMFKDGNQFIVRDGKISNKRPLIHSLMVLGFDVYSQPSEITIEQLKNLKFDFSIFREDVWQGRKVYVVGAEKSDEKSRQFWIDKDRLLFVRSIQPTGRDGKSTQEIQFNIYQKVKSGGWVAPEVVFLVNGKTFFLEEYTQMQFNVDLDDNLFNPNNWVKVDKNYYKSK